MEHSAFISIQPDLPNAPGIYKYYGVDGTLLYIGKAKNIRKRVSSYFTKNNHSFKTHELVRQIRRIEFTIVHSEHDALLLENSLIKEFKPRFNIDLKDDKTYPFIVIRNEPYPRVFLTRRKINDGSIYLGPYTSTAKVRDLLTFIKQHIPLRTCSLNLSDTAIAKGKYKVCLEYHLGNCKGPCVSKQQKSDYDNGIEEIRHILKGNFSSIINRYKTQQQQFIAEWAFEKAEQIQQKLDALKKYQSSSAIVSPRLGDLDVFATALHEDDMVVSYLCVRNGTITNSGSGMYKLSLEGQEAEVFSQAILHLRQLYQSDVAELVVSEAPEFSDETWKITVPKSGEKKKLVELAETNAKYLIAELKRKKSLHLREGDDDRSDLLASLQEALSLNQYPAHIECFDNSNFQGGFPVSAMVCFKNGFPSKQDYRHFNVKTVTGINDFASMKEAVGRRYKRLKEEGSPLPQLVIIDGGKGQLGAAMEAVNDLGLDGQMTLVGLAKNVEEIFFAGDQESLKLGFQSDVLKFLRGIRDEVHRFGITFHRNQRSRGTFTNELEKIKGIGPQTVQELLTHFRSVSNIKKANLESIENVVGPAKAALLMAYFQQ